MHSSAKKLQKVLSAAEVRKTFIDFFTHSHGHKFVRSSPVVPFCDPTLAFTNAGMNQFKAVFQGTAPAPAACVANSQKCVRVGGKHNDLDVVGQDGYHHTFFEMLGNWSFDDYFKEKACTLALELLRDSYGIDPRRLYVTYFAGDEKLNLPADIECLEIWRSLGFANDRILPFKSEENFWEMGPVGPCGPCTEIHMDHNVEPRHPKLAAGLVNKGHPELTELWNLVFIQYNRNKDGSIDPLPAKHVDTGMGFERLTAALQQKSSNYDTDLFTPIFKVIQQTSKVPEYCGSFKPNCKETALDTAYRIMADHMRMVSVCLADGMLPDHNQKLRRVLRKVFSISESTFKNPQLPHQLVPIIVESLGSVYTELSLRESAIKDLIAHEQEIFKMLRENSSQAFTQALKDFPQLQQIELIDEPGFVPAYRELQAQKSQFIHEHNNKITGDFLFKLYDTYGLTESHFHKLAMLENLELDLAGFEEKLSAAKQLKSDSVSGVNLAEESKLASFTQQLPATEYRYRYFVNYNCLLQDFEVPALSVVLRGICHKDTMLLGEQGELNIPVRGESDAEAAPVGEQLPPLYIVTDASNFYVEAGGQQSDKGEILISTRDENLNENWRVKLHVSEARLINDSVVHVCELPGQLVYDEFTESAASEMEGNALSYEQRMALQAEQLKREADKARVLDTVKQVKINLGDFGRMNLDKTHRKLNTCHHTATHLLNGALRCLYKNVVYQVSSSVTSECSKLEVGFIGKRLMREDVEKIEQLLNRVVQCEAVVSVYKTNALGVMQANDITFVPGEVYPETGIRIINIQCPVLEFSSKEPCCGTHVYNTRDLKDICITNFKQTNRARYAFTLVATSKAEEALENARAIKEVLQEIEKCSIKTDQMAKSVESKLLDLRKELLHGQQLLPYVFKMKALEEIETLLGKMKTINRTSLNEFIDAEMRTVLQQAGPDKRYILHYLDSSALMKEVPLQKATRLCKDRAVLVVGICDGVITARCCVPNHLQNEDFDAEKWLKTFASHFGCGVSAPKGQTANNVSVMKGRKLTAAMEEQFDNAMARAQQFVEYNM